MRHNPYARYMGPVAPGFAQTPGAVPPGSPQMGMRQAVPMADRPGEEGMPVPPGALAEYYSDLASGVIVPEDMRVEDLSFVVRINPAGEIVFNSPAVTLISRYQLAIRRVVGLMMDPDLAGPAPFLVSFNIREEGRNFDLFKRPVNMQSLLSRPGAGTLAEWDGVYITVPGTDLSVSWQVDTVRWPALVGTSKELGVQILGDYVACTPRRP